ncbi:glycosyltransferase family 2 protein [Pontibacter ramchanderi]|uniref:Glycosyl transferase family 2 n=1 Tax=Pontibacter ramchanderi TaxID=1179743 RepID=A0A2N3U795_9BACT|nr:glycosyltransferase [Pontibacter ramchanderi]PKV62618.1 glycosyl transferase family 2 [Pontibacter ramchanderi]
MIEASRHRITQTVVPVTVVIPCHNCEDWVSRAINSVLKQSYPIFEVLLIENNSTDGTEDLLRKFEQAYPGLIKVYRESKKGACAARNLGIEKAKGEWIQFLDADDEILPEKIEVQVNIIKEHKPDVVTGDYVRFVQNKNKSYKVEIATEDDPWKGLISSKLGITSANLWKRKSLLQVQRFDENIKSSQEYDLMFRLLQSNHVFAQSHYMHTIVYKQPESISKTNNTTKNAVIFHNRYDLRVRIFNHLEQKGLLSSQYKQEILKNMYYLLFLIGQQNSYFFKEQKKYAHFSELKFINKLKAYGNFVSHYTRMKYADSSIPTKLLDIVLIVKYAYLLRY